MTTHRRIEPWRPMAPDPRIQGVRLLIVGESHYDEDQTYSEAEVRWFTNDVVHAWGAESDGGYQKFFAAVFEVVSGGCWSDDLSAYRAFWRQVYFYNYVQSLVHGGPGDRPTPQEWITSGPAFIQTLEEIRPEAALIVGIEVWNRMTTERAQRLGDEVFGVSSLWTYTLSDGSRIPIIHIPHPASRGFKAANHQQAVRDFLSHVRGC